MNTNQKGFASIIFIIALVVILAGGFGYFELTKKTDTPAIATTTEQVATQTSQVAPIANKITITAPTTGSVLPSDQQTIIRWTIPNAVLDSFPQDFKLGLFLNVQKQGEEGTAVGINDGTNDPKAGSVSWNIPAYFLSGSLKSGVYRIVAYLQAEPKDISRMCARSISSGECGPNEADAAVMERSVQINGESGWFTISSGATSILDNRCTQKAVGTGMCTAVFRAVEFNQSTKKCEYVSVGECNATGPFNATTYPDSDKELNLCQQVCEI